MQSFNRNILFSQIYSPVNFRYFDIDDRRMPSV